jgi:hypothetical protein
MTRSRYVKAPEPTPEVAPLYEAVLKILSGQLTVTAAAESVGLSRLRFQTLMHRGLSGLLEGLSQQPRGRRPTPETEKALLEEVAQLRQENRQLTKQVAASARMMGVASEWMRKGLKSASRQTRTRPTTEETTSPNDSEEDAPARRLAAVDVMKEQGVVSPLAAAAVGISVATARRWRARREKGEPLCSKRGPQPADGPRPEAKAKAAALLVQVRGCMGAVALAKAASLSRRDAAGVRAEVLTKLESDRRSAATRVEVLPGVVRGFDALMAGKTPVLIAADGAVPYRTWLRPAPAYDSASVAQAIARDIELNGAPLVWRMDRAKAHTTPEVLEVLNHHHVLLLQGPPRCPQFYGQLERQNRDHRAWLKWMGRLTYKELERECAQMLEAFNELVPRRTLGWRSAAEAWRSCPKPSVDRVLLANEVEERRRKLEEDELIRSGHSGLAGRLAIQAALINQGLLRLTKGGWC